jgi:hypothetical protein
MIRVPISPLSSSLPLVGAGVLRPTAGRILAISRHVAGAEQLGPFRLSGSVANVLLTPDPDPEVGFAERDTFYERLE